MFVKYPQPGQVKTRLAAAIGEQAAARLAEAFIRTLAARLRNCGDRRELVVWPAERAGDLARLAGDGWLVAQQPPGDLGQRLEAYLRHGLECGADRVVVIGSDSPTLPIE